MLAAAAIALAVAGGTPPEGGIGGGVSETNIPAPKLSRTDTGVRVRATLPANVKTVRIQRRADGRWTTVARATLNADAKLDRVIRATGRVTLRLDVGKGITGPPRTITLAEK